MTRTGLASTSPSVSSPENQAVAAAPAKSATKIRLPAGVVPIPRMIETAANNVEDVKAPVQAGAGQAPVPVNHRPADDHLALKVMKDGNLLYKVMQGGQEVGDNEHVEKVIE